MTHNPYSPPTADVADFEVNPPAQMPVQVLWVVRALWASLILNLVVAFVGPMIKWVNGEPLAIPALVGAVIGAGIWTLIGKWFIGKIAAGLNWARILMLVYTLLGFVGMVVMWIYFESELMAQVGVIDIVSTGIQQLAAVVCLGLLFSSPGKYWFRERQ